MASLFDRTDWGRIRLTGADRVRFLHNQTTNNIEQLCAGQGCHTVFVTSIGRTIDLATVYAFEDSLFVVVSPGMAQKLYEWMDRYIFFSDKVTLSDESQQTFMYTLLGDGADDSIQQLGFSSVQEPYAHQTIQLPQAKAPVTVAASTDLAIAGYTIWGAQSDAAQVESKLLAAGATIQTAGEWSELRIRQGRPMPGAELTDDDNPLESGLWRAISFEKGCYIGQETIARLNTYKGVKKRLWGLQLQEAISLEGDLTEWIITADGSKVGRITSLSAAGNFALGYIRTKAGGEGLDVLVERAEKTAVNAKTVTLPFIHHEYYVAKETV